ncbi:MAG: hypothetical protein KBD16_01135 [Candidatus Pacebacteria bacterium]|nr:hypothetical protein [Candidatus Paceibacterota bacterium]
MSSLFKRIIIWIVILTTLTLGVVYFTLPEFFFTDNSSEGIDSVAMDTEDTEIEKRSCTDAEKPTATFANNDAPRGWNIYTNEEIGFRFFYPPGITIVPETYMTDYSEDGTCVYAGSVRFIADTWEAGLHVTRGDYAGGREGFNDTQEISFTTKNGTPVTLMIDSQCGIESDSDWGSDCGHDTAFTENGIYFLFGSFPKNYLQSGFESMPDFKEIFSTLETLPLPGTYINNVRLVGFEGAPDALFDSARKLAIGYASDSVAIAPDPHLDEIRLIKFREVEWTNSCFTEVNVLPDRCTDGVYSGHEAVLKLDGEYQLWRETKDGKIGDIAGNVDLGSISW